jgi:glutamate-1-semialdehyde 2,1-aminomutase
MNTETSKKLFEEARQRLPGGVSSPVRAIQPYPFFAKKANDSRIWDVDDNYYIDYCMGYGPLMLGHAHPAVCNAVLEQLQRGWDFGTPIALETELAKRIQDDFPSMQMLRYVSTGTEATMSAIRVARGFARKKKIVMIEGGYHGSHDAVLLKAGSHAVSLPSSLGVPDEVIRNTLLVPFNDVDALATILEKDDDIACLIMEPVMGNIGPVLPEDGYLKEVRAITRENDVLLVFDEVITGFRLCIGGAQCYYGVTADLTTLGKIVGGGFPLGVFGGRREIMDMVAPSGGVFNAGTFNGHPVSLAAGLATLNILDEEGYKRVNGLGDLMRRMLADLLQELKINYSVQGIGSMFQVFFIDRRVTNYQEARGCDAELYKTFANLMREQWIFLPPSQYETNFISLAHSNEDLEWTIEAYGNVLRKLFDITELPEGY